MLCAKCGKNIPRDSKLCCYCGFQVAALSVKTDTITQCAHCNDDDIYKDEDSVHENANSEKTVRGYKVETNYRSLEDEIQQAKREAVLSVIIQAMRRLRKQ